jgi:cytoskeletal protein CcmA (bactofilin family)
MSFRSKKPRQFIPHAICGREHGTVGIWKRRPLRLPDPAPPARPAADAGPAPEFLAPPPVLRASLDRDSEVSGKLSFSGPTRIDGTLRGEVRANELLVIGESGYVHGTVRAGSVLLLGRVEGDIVGAERVEIGPCGVLRGSIEARNLVVRDGGMIDGACRVTPPRPATVHVLRPRVGESDGAGAPPT